MTLEPHLIPRLITPAEASAILNVSRRTVLNWIARGSVPYVELPNAGEKPTYRIPLRGLLSSLSGNYDLAAELDTLYGTAVERTPARAPVGAAGVRA
ncbi:MAG TPA: helix-turn-helix domain-containing protein [Solirubrobacteraceae bacterium]|nr:helix-turn-helix domain-containing protein [Solirubrobacteraceae bacterium]